MSTGAVVLNGNTLVDGSTTNALIELLDDHIVETTRALRREGSGFRVHGAGELGAVHRVVGPSLFADEADVRWIARRGPGLGASTLSGVRSHEHASSAHAVYCIGE